MKLSDIYIIIATLAVSFGGSAVTGAGMDWYDTLKLPFFTPPGWFIGIVWTTIFILTAIAAMRVSRRVKDAKERALIYKIFVLNAVLNVLWSAVFFGMQFIGLAFVEAMILGFSVFCIIRLVWDNDRIGAYLLIPYLAWVSFATFLTLVIWLMNFTLC